MSIGRISLYISLAIWPIYDILRISGPHMTLILTSDDLVRTLAPAAASTRAYFSNRRRPWTSDYMLNARASAAGLIYGFNHPGIEAARTVRVTLQGAGGTAAFATATAVVDGDVAAGQSAVMTDVDARPQIPVGAIIKFGVATTEYTVTVITVDTITFTPVLAADVADLAVIKYGTAFSYVIPASTVTLPTSSDLTEANTYLNAVMVVYHNNDNMNGTLITRLAAGALPVVGAFWSVTDAGNFITSDAVNSSGEHVDWRVTDRIEIIVPVTANVIKVFDQTNALAIVGKDFMAAGGSGKTGFVKVQRSLI